MERCSHLRVGRLRAEPMPIGERQSSLLEHRRSVQRLSALFCDEVPTAVPKPRRSIFGHSARGHGRCLDRSQSCTVIIDIHAPTSLQRRWRFARHTDRKSRIDGPSRRLPLSLRHRGPPAGRLGSVKIGPRRSRFLTLIPNVELRRNLRLCADKRERNLDVRASYRDLRTNTIRAGKRLTTIS